MAHLSDEIQDAANRLGVKARRLSTNEADAIRRTASARYRLDPEYLLLYSQLPRDSESIHDPKAWSWLEEFVGTANTFLLFNRHEDPDGWQIPSGKALVLLLAETTGFVFYLTSEKSEYLLCFDDHQCLIGLGTGADWIRGLKYKDGLLPAQDE